MRSVVLAKAPTGPPALYDRDEDLNADSPADRVDVGAAFVRMRLRLQQHIRCLTTAHEQGLPLDMAFAAENLETAVVALAANARDLYACKARIESLIRGALYECRALQDTIANLFEACLRPTTEALPRVPQDVSPAESYPWLRECLVYYAARIDHALSISETEDSFVATANEAQYVMELNNTKDTK